MTTPALRLPPVPAGTGEEYRPGVCNIGPAEIAKRRRGGLAGLAVAGVLAAALVALHAPSAARWLVALPLAGGASGFLQARARFCARFGFAGIRNFGPLGAEERVEDEAALRADRRRSMVIGLQSATIGLAGAAALVVLPA